MKSSPWAAKPPVSNAASPARRQIAALLLLCFALRAVVGIWLALTKPEQFIGVDGGEYLDSARHIVTGHGYAVSQPHSWDWDFYRPDPRADYPKPEVFRPPLYAIALAGVLAVLPQVTWPIALLNAMLSTLAGWFLFDLARRALSERVGAIALLIYSISPILAVLGAKIGAESLFGALLCGCVWALWRTRADRPLLFAALAGLFLGLATLTRSNAIFLWPLGCVWLFFCARTNRLAIVWFTVLMFLALLPWAARNRLQTGQWIFLSGSGGYNFWLGNNDVAYRMFTARSTQEYDRWGRMLLYEVVPEKVRALATSDLGEAQRFWYGEARRFIRQHPTRWLLLTAAKCVEFWRPYVRPGFFPKSYVVLSWLTTLPLFVLGWWGVVLLFRSRPALAWLIVLVMLAGMAGLVLSHVHVRLRAPFVEAFFCIPAAVVLEFCWGKFRRLALGT